MRPFPGANGRIAYTDGGDIYSSNPDGSDRLQLTSHPSVDQSPAWSANGAKLAFATNRAGTYDIYTMNSDGTDQTRITFDTSDELYPTWSPDGRRLAFTRFNGSRSEGIETIELAGGNRRSITAFDSWEPTWSPDGSQIAFQGPTPEARTAIYAVKADGSDLRRISDAGTDYQADWSPDGRRIAFSRDPGIYVVNSDGSGAEANISFNGYFPAWSPDGTKILSTFAADRGYDVYSMNPDGSAQAPIIAGLAYISEAAWGLGTRSQPPPQTSTGQVTVPRCELQVTARGKRLGVATTRKRLPRFPSRGAFRLTIRCDKNTSLRIRGTIVLSRRGRRSTPARSLDLGPVVLAISGNKTKAVRLKIRSKAARRVVREIRRGARVSATFSAGVTNPPASARASSAIVKVRRFRQ